MLEEKTEVKQTEYHSNWKYINRVTNKETEKQYWEMKKIKKLTNKWKYQNELR